MMIRLDCLNTRRSGATGTPELLSNSAVNIGSHRYKTNNVASPHTAETPLKSDQYSLRASSNKNLSFIKADIEDLD